MAKEAGIGWSTLTVDSQLGNDNLDIKNDVTSLDFGHSYELQDTTGIDKSAHERLQLLADFSINLNGVFNDAASKSHVAFKVLTGLRTVAINVSGQTLSNECLFTEYKLTRAENGALTWSAPGVLADGTVPAWS